jgi:hypothetical protein
LDRFLDLILAGFVPTNYRDHVCDTLAAVNVGGHRPAPLRFRMLHVATKPQHHFIKVR